MRAPAGGQDPEQRSVSARMGDFLSMGGHGPYVWGAYGVTLMVVVVLVLATLNKLRLASRLLDALQRARAAERAQPDRGRPGERHPEVQP